MPDKFDMTIHISTEHGEVVVEQHKAGGVTTHKRITPQALCDCFLSSRYDDERRPTGLLPEGCIAVVMEKKYVYALQNNYSIVKMAKYKESVN